MTDGHSAWRSEQEFKAKEWEAEEDRAFASLVEIDLTEGVKRPTADLERYLAIKKVFFADRSHWRHKESDTVYAFAGLLFAATGMGKLALMVAYAPLDNSNKDPKGVVLFSRQYDAFMTKFEPVTPRTVWDRV